MLVVSNIDLTTVIPRISSSAFLRSSIKGFTLNLDNDYRYMKTGYYVSMHAEVLGNMVVPTSENIIDSSRTPILLLRASKAGIPTLPMIVTDSAKEIISELDFPLVLFAVNPFIYEEFMIARNKSALYRAMKSLGMNYKFPVCAQPLRSRMLSCKSFFGKCNQEGHHLQELAQNVYKVFQIPMCKLHIQQVEGATYLCGLQPMKKDEISSKDRNLISEEIYQISKQGDLQDA